MNGHQSIPVEEKYSSRCLEAAPFQKLRTPCSQKSPQRTAWTWPQWGLWQWTVWNRGRQVYKICSNIGIPLYHNNWEKAVKFYYQSPTIVQWTWLTCWYRFSNWLTVNCSGKTTSCMTGGGSGLGERNTFNSCMKKFFSKCDLLCKHDAIDIFS